LAMFGNFLADTYSPNILLIDENTVSSTIHIYIHSLRCLFIY
jgi:hypothetical protein